MTTSRFSIAVVVLSACAPDNKIGENDPDALFAPDAALASPGMVVVPAGGFMMGCSTAVVHQCQADESPYHSVTLAAFEIDRTEVTQAVYQACIAAGSCASPAFVDSRWTPIMTPNRPVNGVAWAQAVAYCAWAGKRLPTEAEWEKAARGPDGRIFPWGDQSATDCAVMHGYGCLPSFADVGERSAGASPYGVLDMAGNADEWVADWYRADFYAVSPAADPIGPAGGTMRITRGGTSAYPTDTRVESRLARDFADAPNGIRCARSWP